MVQLGLDAVLTGTPAAIAKTKVRPDQSRGWFALRLQ